MPTRESSFIVSVHEPGDPGAPYHTIIATEAQVEDLKIAAEHFGLEVTVRRPTAVGTVLQWMAESKCCDVCLGPVEPGGICMNERCENVR